MKILNQKQRIDDLEIFYLRYQNIKMITEHYFYLTPNLVFLYLQSNQIERIQNNSLSF